MSDSMLHKFLIDGGQVSTSIRSGSIVTFPDYWWDIYSAEDRALLQKNILIASENINEVDFLSVQGTAEIIYVPYRYVLNLIRFQRLGSLKFGGVIKIYSPSINVYTEKFMNLSPWTF